MTTLPQDPDLTKSATTPAEKVKQQAREAELNRAPSATSPTGSDTVGAGQPYVKSQAVNQGESLPATALPVKSKHEGARYVNVDNHTDK